LRNAVLSDDGFGGNLAVGEPSKLRVLLSAEMRRAAERIEMLKCARTRHDKELSPRPRITKRGKQE